MAACSPATTETSQVRAVVENFGKRLKNVALLAPDAAQQIEDQYADFVTLDLLAVWMADRSHAPGRLTSSPWPDRIEITTVMEQEPQVYLVTGQVVELTSAELYSDKVAVAYPVELTLVYVDGHWLISDYQADLP